VTTREVEVGPMDQENSETSPGERAVETAPGGALELVREFVDAMSHRELNRAASYLATDSYLRNSDLYFIVEDEWAYAGSPQVVDLDTEVVVRIKAGLTEKRKDDRRAVPGHQFTVRQKSNDGWRIVDIESLAGP
jgi:hypothetical protein